MLQGLTCQNILYLLFMQWTLSGKKCSHDECYMLLQTIKLRNCFKNTEVEKIEQYALC
jgi:hypothetical protein